MSIDPSDWDVERLLNVVQRRTGMRFREDQLKSLLVSIDRVMKRVGIVVPNEFLRAIEEVPNVFHELVDEITIGETYFFREPKHFDFIVRTIIPSIRAARGESTRLSAWSAACASGEEAFSLAIACQKISQPVDIVATDMSPLALSKARRGKYRDWSFRGEAKSRVANYVTKVGDEFLIDDEVRRSVRFELLNLVSETYPNAQKRLANFDLILCRNVLIYFGRETISAIAKRLYQSLRPGGWLITASGDPSLMQDAEFVTESTEYGTFYRRAETEYRASSTSFSKEYILENSVLKKNDAMPPKVSLAKSTRPLLQFQPNKPTPQKTTSSRLGVPAKNMGSYQASAEQSHCLASAQEALRTSQFELAIRLTDEMMHYSEACVINVRARVGLHLDSALETCFSATVRHPLSHELHYLHARILAQLGRFDEAFQAVQKSLFLDRSSVIVHFLFGIIQRERAELNSARRHFENTCELCLQLSPSQVVPMSDGEIVAQIAKASELEINTLPRSTVRE